MKKFLIGFVIVVVGMALGVGVSFGAATLISKVAAKRLAAGTAPAQPFRLNKDGTPQMGPGMPGNGYSAQSDQQVGGVIIRNWDRLRHGPIWGQSGRGIWGPRWNRNGQNGQNNQNGQNGQNGQNNQNGQNGGCQNMGPGNPGMMPNGRGWPRR